MQIKQVEERIIYGISTKTSNEKEMNPKTAKIGKIWEKFNDTVKVDYKNNQRVYGVYYNYESDENGEFSVLAGYETSDYGLDSIKIQKGKYLVFNKILNENSYKAKIDAIIDTWGRIWGYFSNEHSKYKRAYKTDFEYYKNQNEIEIYISIL